MPHLVAVQIAEEILTFWSDIIRCAANKVSNNSQGLKEFFKITNPKHKKNLSDSEIGHYY